MTQFNSNHPLVSVIIPLYNAERYIAETIENVLSQTYQNIEIVVIDDGSRDNSLSIAKKFESNKVKVFTQVNKGASAARNHGLSKAKGVYIQFLDADDLLSPTKIEAQINVLDGGETKVALCTTAHFFDGEDNITKSIVENTWYNNSFENPVDFLLKLYGGDIHDAGMIQPNAWLVPKKLILKAGHWNEELSLDDDGEFFCRVLLSSNGITFAKDSINYYRKFRNSTNLSAQMNFKSINSALESLKLKENHLANFKEDIRYRKSFSLAYKRLAVRTYPKFKDISKFCNQRMNELGGSDHDVTIGGKKIEIVKKIAGWKVARLLQESLKKAETAD